MWKFYFILILKRNYYNLIEIYNFACSFFNNKILLKFKNVLFNNSILWKFKNVFLRIKFAQKIYIPV